jgi:hypothetical protein
MRKFTSIIRNILLPFLLAAPLALFAASPATPLDGKTFTGTLVKQGEHQGDPDDFVFKQGQFVSTACSGFGFKPTTYSVSQDASGLHFQALSETSAGVRMQWHGQIDGDHLQATAKWLRPGQPVIEFQANGKLNPGKQP